MDIPEFFNDSVKLNYSEKSIITTINTKLECTSTFCEGLNLLFDFSSKISKDNLIKYFSHWIGKVLHILNNAPKYSEELIAVCNTIGALVISCKQVPELDKKVSIYSIKQIVNIINERYIYEKSEALINLLVVLLYYHPESCARFQVCFSKIISLCVDEDRRCLVVSGAKCYSLLIRGIERLFIRLSKSTSITCFENSNASCHIFHQIDLCHNLYNIMNELFQDLVTETSELPYEQQSAAHINILQLSKISCHNLLEYYPAITNRFKNICIYLSTLLKVGDSEGKKYALPNVILQVICTGLAITPANFQKSSNENKKDILLIILPMLHAGLLNVLETLILSFRQELVPFATIIQRLILQILEWTQQFSYEPFKNIRILAYKILAIWMRQARSLSGFQLIADEFLPHILKDISPSNDNVVILSTKAHKNTLKSNAIAESLINSEDLRDYNLSNGSTIISKCANSILYSQVLWATQSIISNTNFYLKPSFYDKIKNAVVILLYDQYTKGIFISTSISYRLQLIKTLRIMQNYAHISTPCPTSYAIQIFGIIISQDSNTEIIQEAALGLAEVRHMIYPTTPSLMLTPLSSQLTQPNENTTFLQSKVYQEVLKNDGTAVVEPSEQLTLKEKRFDAEKSILNINVLDDKNHKEDILQMKDDEMIMSFCDIPSINEPNK